MNQSAAHFPCIAGGLESSLFVNAFAGDELSSSHEVICICMLWRVPFSRVRRYLTGSLMRHAQRSLAVSFVTGFCFRCPAFNDVHDTVMTLWSVLLRAAIQHLIVLG